MALRVLLTGSNGLLGQKILEAAPDFGVKMYATSRGPSRYQGNTPVHYNALDLTDTNGLKAYITEIKPDVVIHAGAMTQVDECELHPEACYDANVSATRAVVEACEESNAHLIFLSTDFVFDGEAGPYKETDQPNPLSVYAHSKYEAEKLVEAMKGSWAIFRTILVFGITPGETRSNFALWARNSLRLGKTIQVVTDQYRSPILADDLALACLKGAVAKANGIFHVGGPETKSIYEWVMEVAEFWHLDKTLVVPVNGNMFTQPAKRPLKTGFILDKIHKELGFYPKNFKESLAIMASQEVILNRQP